MEPRLNSRRLQRETRINADYYSLPRTLSNETVMCWPLVNVFEYISSIVKHNTLNKWKAVKLCFV